MPDTMQHGMRALLSLQSKTSCVIDRQSQAPHRTHSALAHPCSMQAATHSAPLPPCNPARGGSCTSGCIPYIHGLQCGHLCGRCELQGCHCASGGAGDPAAAGWSHMYVCICAHPVVWFAGLQQFCPAGRDRRPWHASAEGTSAMQGTPSCCCCCCCSGGGRGHCFSREVFITARAV